MISLEFLNWYLNYFFNAFFFCPNLHQSPCFISVLMCSAGQSMNRWSLEELVKRDPENFLILLQQIIRKTREVRGQRALHHEIFRCFLTVCACVCVLGSGAVSVRASGSACHHVLIYAAAGTDCHWRCCQHNRILSPFRPQTRSFCSQKVKSWSPSL